jgi:catechol 2,3-dioxygenase-like lactoylglutathione lyase family enzyme
MSRVQLALNVSDLEDAVSFYSTLFGAAPAKIRPGYANFAIEEPPLKLVLIEGVGEPGSINHLGVEVATTDEVRAATEHLRDGGRATSVEEATTCCYAVQDKVWVDGPDGARWEVYTVLADAGDEGPGGERGPGDAPGDPGVLAGDGRCCTPTVTASGVVAPLCC